MGRLAVGFWLLVPLPGLIAQAPTPEWVPIRTLTPRSGVALAYDEARARLVLFGGRGPFAVCGDTWEWDSEVWLPRPTGVAPGARHEHSLAHDRVRHRTVLFGGRSASSALGDTWEWDGVSWTQVTAVGPSPRSGHRTAFDPARNCVVLFGGVAQGWGGIGDTWTYDGQRWTPMAAAGPSPRWGHTLVFDAARGRALLFGGRSSAGDLGDTWEWDGSTWRSLSPQTRPPARAFSASAYDPVRRRVVMQGGTSVSSSLPMADTWEWDGTDWRVVLPRHTAWWRGEHAMAHDSARKKVVVFGGRGRTSREIGELGDTWEWDGLDWIERAGPQSPRLDYSLGVDAALAYEDHRDRALLLKSTVNGTTAETWALSGSRWTRLTTTLTPPRRAASPLAHDSVRRRTVMFGGRAPDGTPLGDTWEFDGSNWIALSPAIGPRPRPGHALVFDSVRQRTILIGGGDATTGFFYDTWEWDGATWVERVGHTIRLWQPKAAFDSARGVIVACSSGANQFFTWEWDGVAWSQRYPTTTPPWVSAMAFDPVRQRVLLLSGMSSDPQSGLWDWDGTNWRRLTLAGSGPSGISHALVFDRARQRPVAFVASTAVEHLFWVLGAPSDSTPFGTGCGGPLGIPRLGVGSPTRGNARFHLDLVGVRPAAPCVFGLDGTTWPRSLGGGCVLQLGLTTPVFVGAVANSAGFATLRLPIPLTSALRSVLYAQAFAVDAAGPFAGLVFTAGRDIIVGD